MVTEAIPTGLVGYLAKLGSQIDGPRFLVKPEGNEEFRPTTLDDTKALKVLPAPKTTAMAQ